MGCIYLSRSLHGERGLKLLWVSISFHCQSRSLHGERGLKHLLPNIAWQTLIVAPFTGSVD